MNFLIFQITRKTFIWITITINWSRSSSGTDLEVNLSRSLDRNYSCFLYRVTGKKTAAMVLKKIAQNEPTQDQFKKVLTKSQAFPTINTQIRYSRSQLRKRYCNRLNLFCFGFELFRLEDGILSQRFGQYKCRDVGIFGQTVGDSEWSEDDQPCSQHMEKIRIT